MPLAVILRLDAETAGAIDAMAHTLPERRDDDPVRIYPPHIKLAVFGDGMDAADIDAALSAATGRWQALPITLVGVGIIPTEPAIVGLLAIPSAELLALHAALCRSLADIPAHPNYQIGSWLPHVPLTRSTLVADAVEVLVTTWTGPIAGWLDALDLIRIDPVEVLSRRPLRG